MLNAAPKKQALYLAAVVGLALLAASYFLVKSSHKPHIVDLFETTNGKDTVCCTLENYHRSSKSGPSHSGILFRSFNTATDKEIVHCELSYDSSYGSTDKFLGYKNGFAWFVRNEKPIMIYVFKKDSILEEEAATQLLNRMNPGAHLATISYAPNRGVIYVSLKNGDQFIIDPATLKYVPVSSELESYRYALKPLSLINDANELEVNEREIIALRNISDSETGQRLVKESYSIKNGLYDSLTQTIILSTDKFINAKLALFQRPLLFIQHDDSFSPEAKSLISAFNVNSGKLVWTAPAKNKVVPSIGPKLYRSLNPNRFYSVSDNKEPIKLNSNTGEVLR